MPTTRSFARAAAALLAAWLASEGAGHAQEIASKPLAPAEFPVLPARDAPRALKRASTASPVPDAGDDQIGLVGRQITLNGGRSEPRGALAYRWIQMGGPERAAKTQDGYVLTFTPLLPGVYRFALVVASGGEISEPDLVEVTVGTLGQPPAVGSFGAESAGRQLAHAVPPSIGEVARGALAAIDGGAEAAPALASTFESVADRMALYRTYNDAFSEMSRRLDAFVPPEPARRAAWVERLFQPLTARLVEQMRGVGLDLNQPSAAGSPLTELQKERLADQFRAIAQGLRPGGPTR